MRRSSSSKSVFIFLCFSLTLVFVHCDAVRSLLVSKLGAAEDYKPETDPSKMFAEYSRKDASREKIKVTLKEVAAGFAQPTDLQFPPSEIGYFVVAEKTGALKWGKLNSKDTGVLLQLNATTDGEQGLLGAAFHPDFSKNGKIYLNYTLKSGKKDISRIAEWTFTSTTDFTKAKLTSERVIMEVEQPYPNHNAGQLAFGPDKMLYIGWGDGGWMNDPKKNGQNPKTFLGSMLRVNVDLQAEGKAYSIPSDNPFLNDVCCAKETFAFGFRNPWRYSFDPKGRLIVADVGQDLWEEISIVEKGNNYGWNIKEAFHCFDPKENCPSDRLSDPIYEYGREEGQSITGGYVYTSSNRSLKNKYIFADFITGRIWAFEIPATSKEKVTQVYSLGKWPILISTFGKDTEGNVYVVDFSSGRIYKID
ncbi:PQQ-dependent sugar dehydrogenase [Leptospira idonii]|uniref:Dehydrogenase n=1 Tax=Leptospira idonii TaxID=1193500 RepID=A0A4R9M0B5_9LEPT|nr:PQQ-dependent sugar dehydrogenase [Leptospira idonii]TGN18138.1 dehydrogenase [Leptospira idonii]